MAKTKSNRNKQSGNKETVTMVFEKINYIMMLVSVVLITLGYVIMRMDNQVDGFLSLYVSPLILITGYMGVIAAILWRSKRTEVEAE